MIGHSSQSSIPLPHSEPNAQVADLNSDTLSSRSSKQTSEKESSIGKNRPLARKPDSQSSNLQSYKTIKRKSQEKIRNGNEPIPPKYPRSSQQIKPEGTTIQGSQRSSLPAEIPSRGDSPQVIKFKKKPLTKEEIVEIKDYVQGLEKEESDINSVAGTEKPILNTDIQPPLPKELNKKSKTQYFHIEDFQRHHHIDAPQSENLSQSERNYILSLKQKCKSVDENNSLLQKRISWLREEVEMHLERQLNYQKIKEQLEKTVKKKDKQIDLQKTTFMKEKQCLKKEITQKDAEIQRLKALFVDLHNRFQDDKEIFIQEIQFLRAQKQTQFQQRLRGEQKIKDMEQTINTLMQEKKQIQFSSLNTQQYSKSFVEKLISENKYLKVENHILAKCKDDLLHLQKQLKRVANERDSLKKKIIESAKKQRKRYNPSDEDSQDSFSSFFTLSEISIQGSFKRK